MADDLDLLDDVDDEGEPESTDSDAGTDAPPEKPDDDAPPPEDKRVSDLMGKWQAEEAKNKRLERELAALKSKGPKEPAVPAAVQAWMDAAKDGARERYYSSDPRFAEYGLEQSVIDGSTPDEMRASKKRWSDLIDAMETRVRAQVLGEHGITPEFLGSNRGPKKDYASMSAEEFDKEVARVTGGGFG